MPIDYLVRFVQAHETFRKPELEALAALAEIDLEFLFYSEYVRSDSQQRFIDTLCPSYQCINCSLLIIFSPHFVSLDFVMR